MTVTTDFRRTGIASLIDLLDIGFRGAETGYTRVAALGNNPDVDTLSTEDVWTGGSTYPWKPSAGALELFFTNAADTAAGTGATSVLVNALDGSHIAVSQSKASNGGVVALDGSLLRVNSALIMGAGSNGTNVGDIHVRDAGGGTIRAIIPAGYGITRQSQFTVPAGFTLQVLSQFFGFNKTSASSRFATFATFIQSSTGFYRMPLEITVGDEPPYRHDGTPGIILPEKTDFGLRCTFVSNDNSDLTAAWLGIQRRNG